MVIVDPYLNLPMLSATAEHAMRAVLLLARHGAGTALSADVIADQLGAPRNYLAKTLNALAKAGVVRSARGAAGGFALAIPPEELTLQRVVAPFDDPARSRMCMLRNQPCDPHDPCEIHRKWDGMVGHLGHQFRKTTVAELLDGVSGIAVGNGRAHADMAVMG